MSASVSFLAVDLGASSGRVMDCAWDGARFSLDEAHRFPNAGVRIGADLHWDVLRIWSEIQNGLRRCRARREELPAGIGVDAWGVDFCLLDERDRLLGNPHHYRDSRTNGVPAAVQTEMSGHDLFRATGVQTMEINTVFQLAAMAMQQDRRLMHACSLLMIPDFFQFLLCGEKRAEYTEASTTEIFDLRARGWSREVLQRLELPDVHLSGDRASRGRCWVSFKPACKRSAAWRAACPALPSPRTTRPARWRRFPAWTTPAPF